MTKETVAKQFFMDFIENLGDYEYEHDQSFGEEEANSILTDLFFSGLMGIKWDSKEHKLILNFLNDDSNMNH